jgi:hypothetical protein
MHQYLNGHLPILFNDMAITREAYRNMNEAGVIRYQLRNNDDIYLHPARLSSTERAPYYVFPRKWMAFENLDIKILRKKTEFNARLKTYFIEKLQSNFRCTRMLCPHCHPGIRSPLNSNSSDDENT